MNQPNPELVAVAERLRAAHESGSPIPPIKDSIASVEEAYAVQEANTAHWIDTGRRLTGRKVGLTSLAVQRQLGVDQPDYGMLFADMAVDDGAEIAAGRLIQPRVEAEIAFVLGRDLPHPDTTSAEVLQAIDFAVAAIEIVDSRIADWQISFFDTVADNGSSALYVLGSRPVAMTDFDAIGCGMVMESKGEPVSVGAGSACLGSPVSAAAWLARTMAAAGRPLNAGDTILSGALGPMVGAQPGDAFEARISGLGSVSVSFEGAPT
jgi:2-keto-4-pentenoate hydratase